MYNVFFSECRSPSRELLSILGKEGWTVERFVKHMENNLSPGVYREVCHIANWSNPHLPGKTPPIDPKLFAHIRRCVVTKSTVQTAGLFRNTVCAFVFPQGTII